MRVLMVIRDDAERQLGGDTVQLRKTKAALERRGVTVEVRGTSEIGRAPDCDIAHIFNIQTADASFAALRTLRERGVPVVLSPIYWEMYEHWFAAAVAGGGRWQHVARVLGSARARQLYTAWQRSKGPFTSTWRTQRQLLTNALRVLPNAQSEATLLGRVFALNGTLRKKLDYVPNGIDTELYRSRPTPSEAFQGRYGVRDFVLQVGTISPVKNQLEVIEALFDVPVPLVFIGHAPPALATYAQACRARAAERGNVTFIDHVPHDDLPGVYALAAVHVLPSWRETPGLASLEAAAAGCRVVTTSIGSTRDYFGDDAWYCHPADRASIRAAVVAALQSPLGDQLRGRVLREFTWDQAATATWHAYQSALRQA